MPDTVHNKHIFHVCQLKGSIQKMFASDEIITAKFHLVSSIGTLSLTTLKPYGWFRNLFT